MNLLVWQEVSLNFLKKIIHSLLSYIKPISDNVQQDHLLMKSGQYNSDLGMMGEHIKAIGPIARLLS
jgi:hypothetical protein